MPLKRYGVLRGSAVDRRLASGSNGHYQVHVVGETTDWRIAVNVESALAPSELRYVVVSEFAHPLLDDLAALQPGWNDLPSRAGGAALDFIRGNLFDPQAMSALPFDLPGPDNDLNEKLDHYVGRAVGDELATVYAFGERWGPEEGRKDKIFGFLPGNGVHDIHMNQANVGRFTADDGVWQDGALLLHFPRPEQWVAIFLAFQSQSWHTDDVSGHQVNGAGNAAPAAARSPAEAPARPTRRSASSPRSSTTSARPSASPRRCSTRPQPRSSSTAGRSPTATGTASRCRAGSRLARRCGSRSSRRCVLPNRGGTLTLLDPVGLKVDGVAYSGAQAAEPGRTIVF